jgi:hypothetical protein
LGPSRLRSRQTTRSSRRSAVRGVQSERQSCRDRLREGLNLRNDSALGVPARELFRRTNSALPTLELFVRSEVPAV